MARSQVMATWRTSLGDASLWGGKVMPVRPLVLLLPRRVPVLIHILGLVPALAPVELLLPH
eukprot:4175884-Pyramimonas_sp.AAC.1